MTNRINGATPSGPTVAKLPAARTAPGARVSSSSVRALLSTAQHTLTVLGISALALVALLFARPDLVKQLSKNLGTEAPVTAAATAPLTAAAAAPLAAAATAPVTAAAPTAPRPPLAIAPVSVTVAQAAPVRPSTQVKVVPGSRKEQQWVTSWLSKRYRVAGDAANMLVSTAYLTARDIKLDPLLILAVMAIESGLNPFAESPVGAQGLMQVMSKIHHDKFRDMGGVQAALNPVANIRVGSLILKDYVTRGGSIEAGLKTYVGAGAFETDAGYGSRVLAEYRRLQLVSTGKKVSTRMLAVAAQNKARKNEEIAGL